MPTIDRAPRFLGAMFLVVVVTSLIQGLPGTSISGSASATDILRYASENEPVLWISIVAGIATSAGIIVLATLLYIVLRPQNEILALVALGWWLAEAVFDAISLIGAAALIPLSRDFVAAGSPADSQYQTLAGFLYVGVDQLSYTFHMAFYCVGGIIWYSLFVRSASIPRAIPLFGVAAVTVALVGIVLELFGNDVPVLVYLPILPFELAIGGWLLLRGARSGAETSMVPAAGAIGTASGTS